MKAPPTECKRKKKKISGADDTIENIDKTVKENAKFKNLLIKIILKIQDTVRRPKPWIVGIDESDYSHLKRPVNIFSKIIEENLPNVKKEMPINIKEF